MADIKKQQSTLPGEKTKAKKIILRHKTRILDICDQLIKNPNGDRTIFLNQIQELRKELAKL